MMKNQVEIGKNRTGIALSPIDSQLLIQGAEAAPPSMPGNESAINEARTAYAADGAPIGTMPPPVTIRGIAVGLVDAAKGKNANVFLDKLGERLAFERTGTRLYDAVLSKFDASEPLPAGPARAELEQIKAEEAVHFEMLREVMVSMGGDPTALTPSADVAAVNSMGLLQVLGDPRMNLKQSLEAILVAELVDNDGWETLIELARTEANASVVRRFEQALAEEQVHLSNVRRWVRAATVQREGSATAR
ncbi:MAG TPA: ferritin-like domain-containing protein [Polyangiaceae bacterium]|nr:ferritin-like domain-containing protein [Polyangiaceae bacterium]